MSNITVLERPSLASGKRVAAIVPQTMDETFRLAQAICKAGMAPRGMEQPEKAMIAIMRGMEVGLTPMMALDKIAIVQGRPVIWGDGALGLVRGSGLCEFVKERMEGDGEKRIAYCEAKRKGEVDSITRSFSVSDAKLAGLWNKQGPWKQFPDRMLQMRARAFALRDLFADVLGGLYLKEEMDNDGSVPEPVLSKPLEIDVTPTPEAIPDNSFDLHASIETRNIMIAAIDMAQNGKDLNIWISQNDPTYDRLLEADKQIVIEAIKDKRSSLRKGAA